MFGLLVRVEKVGGNDMELELIDYLLLVPFIILIWALCGIVIVVLVAAIKEFRRK